MDPSREEMEDERYEGRRDRSGGRGRDTRAMTNEYFIPKDGIDREVITADICRYLGNKSLVRPGNYEVCLPPSQGSQNYTDIAL